MRKIKLTDRKPEYKDLPFLTFKEGKWDFWEDTDWFDELTEKEHMIFDYWYPLKQEKGANSSIKQLLIDTWHEAGRYYLQNAGVKVVGGTMTFEEFFNNNRDDVSKWIDKGQSEQVYCCCDNQYKVQEVDNGALICDNCKELIKQ